MEKIDFELMQKAHQKLHRKASEAHILEYIESFKEYFLQLNLNQLLNIIDENLLMTVTFGDDSFADTWFSCELHHTGLDENARKEDYKNDAWQGLMKIFGYYFKDNEYVNNASTRIIKKFALDLAQSPDLCRYKVRQFGDIYSGEFTGYIYLNNLFAALDSKGFTDCYSINYNYDKQTYELVFDKNAILASMKTKTLKKEG